MLLLLSAMASQLRPTGIVFDCGFKIVRPQASGSSILMLNVHSGESRERIYLICGLDSADQTLLQAPAWNSQEQVPGRAVTSTATNIYPPRIHISLHATSSTHHSFIFASVRAA